jgi:hypothetical protein
MDTGKKNVVLDSNKTNGSTKKQKGRAPEASSRMNFLYQVSNSYFSFYSTTFYVTKKVKPWGRGCEKKNRSIKYAIFET